MNVSEMLQGRECDNQNFINYVIKHDPAKKQSVSLWTSGRMLFRPRTYTFTEEGGEIVTGKRDESVPEEEVTLPAPHNNGIDYKRFTKECAATCIKSVEDNFPWIRGTYRWRDAQRDARNTHGKTFKYDGAAGFWKSSIYELVRDFNEFTSTGVDPREGKLARKVHKKANTTAPTEKTKKTHKIQNAPNASSSGKSVGDATDAMDVMDTMDSIDAMDAIDVMDDDATVPRATDEVALHAEEDKKGKKAKLVKKWVPVVEESYIQNARMVISCNSLLKHLKEHPDGDYVKNPYRKLAGAHTLTKTKESSKDNIKKVITDWILKTPNGKTWLRCCNLNEGEFTVDRVISRKGKNQGTNCVWNLLLMPGRVNSYFNTNDEKKRDYVGEKAWKVAMMANEVFHQEAEIAFDFEAACGKKASAIMLSVDM